MTLTKGERAAVGALSPDEWRPRPRGAQVRTLVELERRQTGQSPPRWRLRPAALRAAEPAPIAPKAQTPIEALLCLLGTVSLLCLPDRYCARPGCGHLDARHLGRGALGPERGGCYACECRGFVVPSGAPLEGGEP